jgi:hypothetical protein
VQLPFFIGHFICLFWWPNPDIDDQFPFWGRS